MASGASAGCSLKLFLSILTSPVPPLFTMLTGPSTSLSLPLLYHIHYSIFCPPTCLITLPDGGRAYPLSFSVMLPQLIVKSVEDAKAENQHVFSLSSLLAFCPVLLLFSLSVHFFVYQVYFLNHQGGWNCSHSSLRRTAYIFKMKPLSSIP